MKTYIILSEKKWNNSLIRELENSSVDQWILINNRNDFNIKNLKEIKPDIIFIPHWSYIIPSSIFSSFECIVFHMTDLPYGRGGSPLQNLIVRGYKDTKLSALRVEEGLDTGDIYLKRDLSLKGTAQEIFERANELILQMIIEIVKTNPKPLKQKGEPYLFKRRTPSMSSMQDLDQLEQIYDYIRMLDAEGYPKAFIETESFRFEFRNVSKQDHNTLEANVRIIKK